MFNLSKTIIKTLAFLLATLVIVPLTGCNRDKSAFSSGAKSGITGIWITETNTGGYRVPRRLILFEGGTGAVGYWGEADSLRPMSWVAEKKLLLYAVGGSSIANFFEYNLSESASTLTLTDVFDRNKSVVYNKQNM